DVYARVRHPARRDDQPFDRRQWFLQVRKWVRSAGWKIVRSDGAVHQLPIIPGHNPIGLPFLESKCFYSEDVEPVFLSLFPFGRKACGTLEFFEAMRFVA